MLRSYFERIGAVDLGLMLKSIAAFVIVAIVVSFVELKTNLNWLFIVFQAAIACFFIYGVLMMTFVWRTDERRNNSAKR